MFTFIRSLSLSLLTCSVVFTGCIARAQSVGATTTSGQAPCAMEQPFVRQGNTISGSYTGRCINGRFHGWAEITVFNRSNRDEDPLIYTLNYRDGNAFGVGKLDTGNSAIIFTGTFNNWSPWQGYFSAFDEYNRPVRFGLRNGADAPYNSIGTIPVFTAYTPSAEAARPVVAEATCGATLPTDRYFVTGTYPDNCRNGLMNGVANLTLTPKDATQPTIAIKAPFRNGVLSGQVTATYPQLAMEYKGTFDNWQPNDGVSERPLGNAIIEVKEFRGGAITAIRQENRAATPFQIALVRAAEEAILRGTQRAIDNGVRELYERDARRENNHLQAEQERQNAERIRLANEENARRNLAQARVDRDRQLARDQEIIVQQTQLAADAKANAERQAADKAEADERTRLAQIESDTRQAERDAETRQRQMAQNTFSGATLPPAPVFGGSTEAPVVTTNPPEGVPPPTVGTNPPRSEVPPPLAPAVNLSPTFGIPDVPPPLPSEAPQPDLRPTYSEPPQLPAPTTLPAPLPSGQDLRPSFPSQPAQPVQAPTRNDTLGSGSTNSQPAPVPTYTQPTRTNQQASSPSVPSVPTGLYPTATGELALPIPLGWSEVAGATRYRITVKDTFANTFPVDDQFVTTNRFTVRGLEAGRTFTWDVAACNQTGCSARSQNSVFRTGVTREAPPIGDPLMQCLMADNGRRLPTGDRASSFAFTLIANAKTARAQIGKELYFERLKWYYSLVRNRGSWDYKQRGSNYENFGNFHFGFVGAAAEIPDPLLLRLAGWAQRNAGTSDPNWDNFLGAAPYGDDPNDQNYIRLGISLYRLCQRNF